MFEQNEPTNKSNNNQCNSIWGASDNHCDNPAILNDKLPKVKNHTAFHNPDSYNLKKALIIRYAGKAIGWYKYWLNIKKHWHQRTCKHRLEQSKGMQISWRKTLGNTNIESSEIQILEAKFEKLKTWKIIVSTRKLGIKCRTLSVTGVVNS